MTGAGSAVALPGGEFLMGSAHARYPEDGEWPVRRVRVGPFSIDRHAVTNARFARFVRDTGHVTDAERLGWSFVFAGRLAPDHPPTRAVAAAPWWRAVPGARWDAPEGPGSDLEGRLDHPVVHVSWRDAAAFAAWAGGRLPTEAEWEYAARGGLEGQPFPWGDELTPGGKHMCNVWQGAFPYVDTGEDGYRGTAPVDAYEPNGYGLHCVVGNVWELTADAWTLPGEGVSGGAPACCSPAAAAGTVAERSAGPRAGTSAAPRPAPAASARARVIKGGSYLCHASYCERYRVAARAPTTEDSTTGHVGFRLAY